MKDTRKILLVDDDRDLSLITGDMLRSYGYDVRIVPDCESAFTAMTEEAFSLVLLDINLKDGSGFEICEELRRVSRIPVIFVSARTDEDDKITGFHLGGDDYLAKPYSLKELLARVNAVLRRSCGGEEQPVYRIGNLSVDTGTRTVMRGEDEIRLSLKEFDVLACLCRHRNQTVGKEELLHEVWGAYTEAETATVAVHIRWLREKLEENPAKPRWIKTVWGIGYRLEEPDRLKNGETDEKTIS